MAINKLVETYPSFYDLQGQPLENGSIYIGEENKNPETNPISIYLDQDLATPVAQPLKTSNGYIVQNGSPVNIYLDQNYSITVKDKNNNIIYTELSNGISNAINDLENTVNARLQTDTIADLRALTQPLDTVYVSGYHIKGDGAFGSNIFEWDSESIEADNGGTIIKLSSIATGRYKLKYTGAINVRWFGVDKTGNTNDFSILNNVFNAFDVVEIDSETIANSEQKITTTNKLTLVGGGTLKTKGNNTQLLPQANLTINNVNLTIDVTDFNSYTSFNIEVRSDVTVEVVNSTLKGASYDCIYCSSADANIIIKNLETLEYGRWGVATVGSNSIDVDNLYGSSSEATKLGLFDAEPNNGNATKRVSLRNIETAEKVQVWFAYANNIWDSMLFVNCSFDILTLRNVFNTERVFQLINCRVATFEYVSFGSTTLDKTNVFTNAKISDNKVPNSLVPDRLFELWASSNNPQTIEDYIEFDTTGAVGFQNIRSDFISLENPTVDYLSFGATIKGISSSDNRAYLSLEQYDNANVLQKTDKMSIVTVQDYNDYNKIINLYPNVTKFKINVFIDGGDHLFRVKRMYVNEGISSGFTCNKWDKELNLSSIPISGTYFRGQRVRNTLPSAGGNIGWVCTSTGTPGAWKAYGSVEA